MPGYVQPVQVFQSPDQGLKRDLSPLAAMLAEHEGKRVRLRSGEQTLNDSVLSDMAVREFTIKDIMTEMKNLATKDDIAQIKSSLVAQSAEIEQLRAEMGKHHDRIKSLEEQATTVAIEAASRTRPEASGATSKQHGSAHSVSGNDTQTRRRSVIMHGLNKVKDDELMETVLDVCQAVELIVFASDIDDITRLGRPEPGSKREVPVRVTFHLSYMRDKLLRVKKDLITLPRFANLFINPDEPHEVRRNKGIFRRIAAKAREDGQNVVYRGDWIKIGDSTYSASEIKNIPAKYQPDSYPGKLDRPVAMGPAGPTREVTMDVENETGFIYGPDVNMKLTKAGLTFSGPTAFVSNMHPCEFTYNDQPYTSTEQGIQHLNAVHHDMPDIARKILDTSCAKKIKIMSHDIPKSESWPKIAPGKLWDLNMAKYDQNPPLLKKLIETAPHKLVEATLDSHWGGGAPMGDDVYEQGIVPGKNTFGDIATTLRDQKIAQQELSKDIA